MTTISTPAAYLSNTHDADMRAMASRTRAAEMKLMWDGICKAITGKFRNDAPQVAITTLDRPAPLQPIANDESFQKAA